MELTREEYLHKAAYAVGVPLAMVTVATIAETLHNPAQYEAMMTAQTNNYNMLFSHEPLNREVSAEAVNLAQYIPDYGVDIGGISF